jgi:xanthine dehydrogenase accessory factor
VSLDVLARAEAMRRQRTPYVLATVVRAQRPTSAKPGDHALILADGTLEGFVGGVCAESTVRGLGVQLLASGTSALLRITPDPDDPPAAGRDTPDEGFVVVNNPCLSGGSVEIFLQAMVPPPLVRVYGDTPVARALLRIGAAAGYDMTAGSPGDPIPPDAAAVVVASHGRDEEPALATALEQGVAYVALVASRRRGDAVLASLGVDRDRIRTPAGLDIGARTAAEIAISILAEFVSLRQITDPGRIMAQDSAQNPEPALTVSERDPVCGMSVEVTPTAVRAEHAGHTFYFCASGCKAAFLADPHHYLTDE